jgi:hypothetical protein
MGGVGVGVQEADGGGFDLRRFEAARQARNCVLVEWLSFHGPASMRPPMVKARSRGTIRSGFCKSMAYWS